jgi:DNA/RNA-binding domain of Phe-tRNA-synthetase-like protein
VAAEVEDEFRDLGLRFTTVLGPKRASPRIVKRQLEELSDAVDARRAVALRARGPAAAVRVFQRQIGLDPEADRTMLDAAIVDRMLNGAFLPRGLPADACTIAALETGVPVWAIDSRRLIGILGIGTAEAGEQLGRAPDAPRAEDRCLTIADHAGPLTALLSSPASEDAPGARSDEITLFAVRVPGTMTAVIDEALWIASAVASEPASAR